MSYHFVTRRTLARCLARWTVFLGVAGSMSAMASPAAAQTITVNNQLANKYAYTPFPSHCPNGPQISNIPTGYRIERPHWVFNDTTGKWVLWAHYEASGYGTAQALVASSTSECGPYTIAQTFRPLGYEVRDDYLYKDDDGTAYFMAASRKNNGANDTLAIFRLTSDYLDVDQSAGVTWAFENKYREAPVVMKKGAIYFLLTSQAAGWFPSQGAYATSTSMLGPWSDLSNLGNPSTFGGQNAGAEFIKGSGSTANVLIMDHLGGNTARDDGAIWLPVLLDDTKRTATMDWYSTWYVNSSTGALTLPSTDSIAANRPATASSTGSGSSPQNANDRDYYTRWVASGSNWPAWWQVDLQSRRHMSEIQISWPMVKGSEAYYKYQLQFSDDGSTWTTVDRTDNQLYGFTVDKVDQTARYLRVVLVDAKIQNSSKNWYTPGMWHVRVLP